MLRPFGDIVEYKARSTYLICSSFRGLYRYPQGVIKANEGSLSNITPPLTFLFTGGFESWMLAAFIQVYSSLPVQLIGMRQYGHDPMVGASSAKLVEGYRASTAVLLAHELFSITAQARCKSPSSRSSTEVVRRISFRNRSSFEMSVWVA
jgi:hypothetical protein